MVKYEQLIFTNALGVVMFDDNTQDQTTASSTSVPTPPADNSAPASTDHGFTGAAIDPAGASTTTDDHTDVPSEEVTAPETPADEQPGAPEAPAPTDDTETDDHSSDTDEPAELPAPSSADDEPADSPAPADGDLVSIKQSALSQLSPLVGHLDQSPADKFRTLMMMIQAADDQSLIKEAYEAAQNIDDEKERAQALLDVVNEINYFTHQPAADK